MEQNSNNIPELQSPFEQLREVDADGKEWWNSRKLARVMGYGKYWNFERVIAKAQAWTSQKGYHLGDHFVEITEMAELGSGAVREVTSIRLSRAACMAVAMNADQKKEMVRAAQQYFSATMTPDVAVRSMESSILMYKGGRGKVQVQVVFDTNTFWLSQQRMAELFGVTVPTINYHLDQIEQSGEIHLSDTIRKIRIPSDKWSGEVMMYNLDTVIAVGYRVNSYEATQFRIWATQVLKEYLTKGFVLDDERLKGKNVFGADYFDDLLDRIREIRISERRYYQKITDIYSECSSDYDKDSEETQLFFKTVQNIMHYAVTKQTAAEIIYDRADAERPHMGFDNMEECSRRKSREIGCYGSQELSERKEGGFVEQIEQCLHRHCRATCRRPHPNDNGRLVGSPATLYGLEQPSLTSRCWACDSRTSGRKGFHRI